MLRPALLVSLCGIGLASVRPCQPDDEGCLRGKPVYSTVSGGNLTLKCPGAAGNALDWYMARRSVFLGSWRRGKAAGEPLANRTMRLNADGSLFVYSMGRHLVEEYECTTADGATLGSVLVRLDFSYFYEGELFSTVFYGACMVSVIACAASFLLNLLWIAVRQFSLWWINRSERITRVRNVVEAMEKYRQRQMEGLHENYQKKVQTIRDNYHQQVEELRQSYAKQADRFRDYRQAQMESMTQHLDNIRDNYNQQLTRIREYGSRRAEQLVESYERQLNRMRTFTLQHRLKLMRQYRVKQNYINRLLENIASRDNAQVIHQNEQQIRAVLDLPDPGLTAGADFEPGLPRAGSFYSLPEFVLDEEDEPHAFRRPFPELNFQQLRREAQGGGRGPEQPHSSNTAAEPEDAPQADAPLLGRHRRRPSLKKQLTKDADSLSTNSQ